MKLIVHIVVKIMFIVCFVGEQQSRLLCSCGKEDEMFYCFLSLVPFMIVCNVYKGRILLVFV